MFHLLRSIVSGVALGGVLWVVCCVVAVLGGAGDWMVSNSYALSNWLMTAGGFGGLAIWVLDRKTCGRQSPN